MQDRKGTETESLRKTAQLFHNKTSPIHTPTPSTLTPFYLPPLIRTPSTRHLLSLLFKKITAGIPPSNKPQPHSRNLSKYEALAPWSISADNALTQPLWQSAGYFTSSSGHYKKLITPIKILGVNTTPDKRKSIKEGREISKFATRGARSIHTVIVLDAFSFKPSIDQAEPSDEECKD